MIDLFEPKAAAKIVALLVHENEQLTEQLREAHSHADVQTLKLFTLESQIEADASKQHISVEGDNLVILLPDGSRRVFEDWEISGRYLGARFTFSLHKTSDQFRPVSGDQS